MQKLRNHNVLLLSLFLMLTIPAVSQKQTDSINQDSIFRTIELDSIIIMSRIHKIDDQGSRLIYNVYQEKVNSAVSSIDILRKTPMVSVDLNGNISIKGNQSIKILVNERDPGGMSYSQILDQIPAGDVMKIEVITSPSAKYDAQGIGGIINIVTRKKIYFKSSGYTNLGIGTKGSHLMGNYSYAFNDKWSMQNSIYSLIGYSKTTIRQNLNNQEINSSGHSLGQLYGYQFRISKTTDREDLNLSLQYIYQNMKLKENPDNKSSEFAQSKVNSGYSYYRAGIDYSLNISPKINLALSSSLYFLPTNNKLNNDKVSYQNGYDIWNNTSAMDWTIRNIQKLEIETGIKYSFNHFRNNTGQNFIQNSLTVGNYLNLMYKISPLFNLHGGIRYEYYHITCLLDRRKTYHDIFYNAGSNYKIGAESALSIDFNRRITRPTYVSLLPAESYTSTNIIQNGNAAIQPEYSYNLEIGWSNYIGDCFLKLSPYYQYIKHPISNIISMDKSRLIQTATNLDKEKIMGGSLWFTLNLLQGRFNMNGGINCAHKELSAGELYAQGNQYTANINLTWRFAPSFYINCYGSWASADIYLQGKQNSYTYSNFSIQKSWMNDNFKIALSIDNPFTSSISVKRNYELDGLRYKSDIQYHNRGLRIFFNYKFGKKDMERNMKIKQNILNNY